jgi:hypothetical protein
VCSFFSGAASCNVYGGEKNVFEDLSARNKLSNTIAIFVTIVTRQSFLTGTEADEQQCSSRA